MKNDNVKNKLSKYFSKKVLDNINFLEINKDEDVDQKIQRPYELFSDRK